MTTIAVDATPAFIEAPAPTVHVNATSGFVVGDVFAEAAWPMGARDQVVITEAVTGRRLMELRGAVLSRPSWELNGIGTASLAISVHDPALLSCLVRPGSVDLARGQLMLVGREVQWWRNGALRWEGVPVSAEVDMADGVLTLELADLGWYLSRRFVGSAERRDLLSGIGQMDTVGLPGWTRSGGVTAVRNTSVKVRGAGSAMLSGSGAISATFTHPPLEVGQDLTVLASAMVRLPAGTPVGSAVLSIQAVPDGSTEPYRSGEWNNFTTTQDTELGAWTRVTAYATMRPGVAHDVTVTLWKIAGGSTYFDDVRAMKNDTTGFPAPGEDTTKHGVAIINTAQAVTRGKGTFGFKPKVLEPTGVVETLGIRHLEHPEVLDLFDAYVEREEGGWDWWIVPGSRRVYFAPRRGTDHTDKALSDRSVLAGGWSHDESRVSSSVVVLGEGDGIDRPEGGFISTTKTAGLVLDYLDRPPNNTPLSALDPRAKSLHARLSQPQTTLRPVVVPGDWWDEVSPGDRFPNHLAVGVLKPADDGFGFRVQRITYDLESDTLELV